MRIALTLAVLIAATAGLAAQQPAFRSGVDLVRIPISVTQGDQPVEPEVLTGSDFKISEDGIPQEVSFFQRESLPLSICVVFDASNSMGEGFIAQFAVAVFRQVVTRLLPEDELSVVAFADRPVVVAPWTAAPATTAMSINLETKGGTALTDAVATALQVIDTAHNPKRAVLLITDGGENASKTRLSQVVKTRQQSETAIYAFNIAPPVFSRDAGTAPGSGIFDRSSPSPSGSNAVVTQSPAFTVLPSLVGDSGGVEYRIRSGSDAADLARGFVDDLRFQYTIGYTSQRPLDGKYHRVRVEMKKRGFKIRHRGGYLAQPSPAPDPKPQAPSP